MAKILFISASKVKAVSVVEDNVDDKVLSNVIATVQETQLKPILGKALYKIVEDFLTEKVADSTFTIPEPEKELIDDYIQPFLVHATVADFIAVNNYKLTNKGTQKLNDNSSTAVSSTENEYIKNHYDNLVSTYKNNLLVFLKENTLLEHDADTNITLPLTGWFFDNGSTTSVKTGSSSSPSDELELDPVWIANKANFYTKTQIDALLTLEANLISPAFTTPNIGVANGTSLSLSGSVTASSIVKTGGTATQILMADGSVYSKTLIDNAIAAVNTASIDGLALKANILSPTLVTPNIGVAAGTSLNLTYTVAGIGQTLKLKNATNTNANHGVSIVLDGVNKHALISTYENPTSITGGNLQLQTYSDDTTLNLGIFLNRLGNVGINTITPTAKFEVHGSLRSTRTNTPTQYLQMSADSIATYLTALNTFSNGKPLYIENTEVTSLAGGTGGSIQLRTGLSGALTTKLMVYANGNVCVGDTTDNGFKFDVTGSAKATTLRADTSLQIGTTGTVSRKLHISNVNGGIAMQISLNDVGGTPKYIQGVHSVTDDTWMAATHNIRICSGTTVGSIATAPTNERMVITTAGNVGIGVTNPSTKLQVGDGTGSNYLSVMGSSSALYMGQTGNTRFGLAGNAAGIIQSTALFPFAVGTFSTQPFILGADNKEVIRITEVGQVGINQTTPAASAILDVQSTNQGVLVPRMTTAQKGNLLGGTAATGLLIYDTTVNSLMQYNGSEWQSLYNVPSKMTTTQRNAIVSPAEGLTVYDLTTHSMWYFNATAWIEM